MQIKQSQNSFYRYYVRAFSLNIYWTLVYQETILLNREMRKDFITSFITFSSIELWSKPICNFVIMCQRRSLGKQIFYRSRWPFTCYHCECIGLKFIPNKSQLFRVISNQSEKRFVSCLIKNGQEPIQTNPRPKWFGLIWIKNSAWINSSSDWFGLNIPPCVQDSCGCCLLNLEVAAYCVDNFRK